MLHTETVAASTLDLLKRLQRLPGLSNTRLVGGTALALHLGHRKSVDLDLFGSFDPMPEMFDSNLTWDGVKRKIVVSTRAFILKENG